MDNISTGIGGILIGWLLAQGGFFFQRRVSLRGEISKAAYFLILVLDELDSIISLKEGKFVEQEFADDISKYFHGHFIGQSDFNKEVSSICEKVSMVNIKIAYEIRTYCMLADQAARGTVKAIRTVDKNAASLSASMFLDALVFSRYNLEQALFHLLIVCDFIYFVKFCIKLGWEKSKNHALKKKTHPKLGIEGLTKTLATACDVLNKAQTFSANRGEKV